MNYVKPAILDYGSIAGHTFALQAKPVVIDIKDGALEEGRLT